MPAPCPEMPWIPNPSALAKPRRRVRDAAAFRTRLCRSPSAPAVSPGPATASALPVSRWRPAGSSPRSTVVPVTDQRSIGPLAAVLVVTSVHCRAGDRSALDRRPLGCRLRRRLGPLPCRRAKPPWISSACGRAPARNLSLPAPRPRPLCGGSRSALSFVDPGVPTCRLAMCRLLVRAVAAAALPPRFGPRPLPSPSCRAGLPGAAAADALLPRCGPRPVLCPLLPGGLPGDAAAPRCGYCLWPQAVLHPNPLRCSWPHAADASLVPPALVRFPAGPSAWPPFNRRRLVRDAAGRPGTPPVHPSGSFALRPALSPSPPPRSVSTPPPARVSGRFARVEPVVELSASRRGHSLRSAHRRCGRVIALVLSGSRAPAIAAEAFTRRTVASVRGSAARGRSGSPYLGTRRRTAAPVRHS